jgi:cobalt/nickel transport system permease protein
VIAAFQTLPTVGYFGRVDPRVRVIVAVFFSLLIVVVNRWSVLGIGAVAVVFGWFFSGLPLKTTLRKILPFNLLMLALLLLLPLTTSGETFAQIGPMQYSFAGLELASMIAVKGNLLILLMAMLLGTMDATVLGHALSHLRLPDKLVHLLLFPVRYLAVLHREYVRLRAAMKVRGFRPRMNRHTYRTFAYLVGMLLVHGFDRAERILAAMKCRGFHGHFHLLHHFSFSRRRDVPFCVVAASLFLLLVAMEWGIP